MESVEESISGCPPPLKSSGERNEMYSSELESILNSEAFHLSSCSSAVKNETYSHKADSKQSCDFLQLGHSTDISSIPLNHIHCDNLLDVTDNILLPPAEGFHKEMLPYSMTGSENLASALESMETENCSAGSNGDLNTVEKLESTSVAQCKLTEMADDDKPAAKFSEEPDCSENISNVCPNEANSLILKIGRTSEILAENSMDSSLPPNISKESLNCSMSNNNSENPVQSSENAETRFDENQSKSEDEFTNTSPISSEELSLDSGVASLDDQEQVQQTKTSCTDASDSCNLSKKERKRTRSSLSKPEENSAKRKKCSVGKLVSFSGVTVFYFLRRQSFVTVPSQGGSTLGMSLSHNHVKKMSLKQHRKSVVHRRRSMEREQNRQQRISMKLKQLKQTYPNLETGQLMPMVVESEPEEESSDSSSESEDDEDDSTDDNYFLQPIPTKKRRLLLRMSGVQKIDSEEKLLNKLTRESREVCGCDCSGVCNPANCLCALSGIPCQVDRESFPCGCSSTGCANPNGRVEFDAQRVRNHYTRTMRRLRLEETGMTPSEADDQHMAMPEPKRSPYVSVNFQETIDNMTASPTTNSATSTSSEEALPHPNLSPPTSNFNHSNNGPIIFTQNSAKKWYSQPSISDMYQIPSIWESNPQPEVFQTNAGYQTNNAAFHGQQASSNRNQFIEPQPVNISNTTASSENQYLSNCAHSMAESDAPESCANRYGSTFSKSSTLAPLDISNADLPTSSFRLDPIASFFPPVDVGSKVTAATGYDGNFPSTSSVANTLASCQKYCDINYQGDMESISTGLHFQNCDGDNLSIATSVSDHGQDAVDVIA